jgi:hypothetical protein
MVLAAHNVRDPEIDVIGAGGEMVGRSAAASQKREILNVSGHLGLLAVDEIAKGDGFTGVARDAKTKDELLAERGATIALFAGDFALAGIKEPGSASMRFLRFLKIEGSEIAVSEAAGEDLVGQGFVESQTLRLAVLLVPIEAELGETVED